MTATVTVTNTGDRAGSEVVQLYVHDVETSVFRPEQELKAFAKVRLATGGVAGGHPRPGPARVRGVGPAAARLGGRARPVRDPGGLVVAGHPGPCRTGGGVWWSRHRPRTGRSSRRTGICRCPAASTAPRSRRCTADRCRTTSPNAGASTRWTPRSLTCASRWSPGRWCGSFGVRPRRSSAATRTGRWPGWSTGWSTRCRCGCCPCSARARCSVPVASALLAVANGRPLAGATKVLAALGPLPGRQRAGG